jgi:hypothetical protein
VLQNVGPHLMANPLIGKIATSERAHHRPQMR